MEEEMTKDKEQTQTNRRKCKEGNNEEMNSCFRETDQEADFQNLKSEQCFDRFCEI